MCISRRLKWYRLGQRDGLKWCFLAVGLNHEQIYGKLQPAFQFVLDASALHDGYSRIAFNQKIDIPATRLIV